MRVTQLKRRFFYCAFGAVPASSLLYTSHVIPDSLNSVRFDGLLSGAPFALMAIGALLGTLGLWIALAMRLPARERRHRWGIAVLMAAGPASALPWSVLISYLSVANLVEGHTAEDLRTIAGKAAYLSNTMYVNWLMVGPSVVALHYLVRYSRRASNNAFERSRGQ